MFLKMSFKHKIQGRSVEVQKSTLGYQVYVLERCKVAKILPESQIYFHYNGDRSYINLCKTFYNVFDELHHLY